MASHNDITGDALVSRPGLSEEGEKNWDKIFTKRKTNGGWKPPLAPLTAQDPLCKVCGKALSGTKECAWTSCPLNWNENRVDTIGQNGNDGLHYEDTQTQTVSETDVSKPDT